MVEETEAQGAQYGPTISSGGIELLVHSSGCLPDRFFKEFTKLKKKSSHNFRIKKHRWFSSLSLVL